MTVKNLSQLTKLFTYDAITAAAEPSVVFQLFSGKMFENRVNSCFYKKNIFQDLTHYLKYLFVFVIFFYIFFVYHIARSISLSENQQLAVYPKTNGCS